MLSNCDINASGILIVFVATNKLFVFVTGLLADRMNCPRCGTVMQEKVYNRVMDGCIWRCPPKICRATVSTRKGSFFEKSHLPLTKLLDLLYYWSMDLSNAEAQFQVYKNQYM